MLNLNPEQEQKLKGAVFAISDARYKLKELNEEMKEAGQWYGQGDVEYAAFEADELCENGLKYFLENL